jgi:hypothetical protein
MAAAGVLSVEEWAAFFDVEEIAVRRWIRKQCVPYLSINKGMYVAMTDLEAYGKVRGSHGEEEGERGRVDLPVREDVGSKPERQTPRGKNRSKKSPGKDS